MNQDNRTLGRLELETRVAGSDGIPCVLATDAAIDRGGYREILDHTPGAVDLTRAEHGLALLLHHDPARPIGRIDHIRIDSGKLRGIAKFGTSPEARQTLADVEAGILPSLSVGYRILDFIDTPNNTVKVTRWTPYEASIVAIPADLGAGMYRNHKLENPTMEVQTRTEIEQLATRHGIPNDLKAELLAGDVNIVTARTRILDYLASRDVGRDFPRTDSGGQSADLSGAIDARMGVRGANGDNRSLIEIAAACLESANRPVDRRWSRQELVSRAMSVSDFPNLLAASAGRVLEQAYELAPPALKAVARLATLPDFRDRTVIRLGAAPSLDKVHENGEYHYSYLSDANAAYRLSTYGRIIALSRQAIVNDDLGAFSDLLRKFGESAARREGDVLADVLMANPTIDGDALFNSDRGNLLTGASSALGATGLAAAVLALRKQKEIDGGFIAQKPAFLVVPAALEVTALQLVSSISPTKVIDANPLGQGLEVVVEPRLDDDSETAWYLATMSGSLEYGYLEGQEGVYIETRNGFEVDGMEIKARLDFGAGFVAPTGWIKSAGA